MPQPSFSPDEKRLLVRRQTSNRRDQWGWLLVLLPFTAFALYGLFKQDAVAVFIAWAGTTAVMIWWWSSAIKSAALLSSILRKYDESTVETRTSFDAGR